MGNFDQGNVGVLSVSLQFEVILKYCKAIVKKMKTGIQNVEKRKPSNIAGDSVN